MAIEEVSDELAALRQNLLAKGPEHLAHLVHQRRERRKKKGKDGSTIDGEEADDAARGGKRRPGEHEGEEEEGEEGGSDPEIFPSAEAPASEGSEEEDKDKDIKVEGSIARRKARLLEGAGAEDKRLSQGSFGRRIGSSAAAMFGGASSPKQQGTPRGEESSRGSFLMRRSSANKDGQSSPENKSSRERSSPSSAKNSMISRTMSAKSKVQATFRTGKTRDTQGDRKRRAAGRKLSKFEHDYKDELLAKAQYMLDQVGPGGGKLKAMEDRLKKAKAPAKEALAALREREKELKSNAKGSSKEAVEKARRVQRPAERVVEMLTDRVRRVVQMRDEASKLVKYLRGSNSEDASPDENVKRMQELERLLDDLEKECARPLGDFTSVKVHRCDEIEADLDIQHPCVLMSVVDVGSGDGTGYLEKANPGACLTQQHEGSSVPASDGQTLRPAKCTHVLPQMTHPCDLASSGGGRGGPVWEDELALDADPEEFMREGVVLFFEVVDFRVGASHAVLQRKGAWRYIAWGFLKLRSRGLSDGTSRLEDVGRASKPGGNKVHPGPDDSFYPPSVMGRKVRLQLHKYDSRWGGGGGARSIGSECVAAKAYKKWVSGGRWDRYPGCIEVTVSAQARPAQQMVPRLVGFDVAVSKGKGGADGGLMRLEMAPPVSLGEGDVVVVSDFPAKASSYTTDGRFTGSVAVDCVPRGSVEKQAEWRRGEGGKAELALTISRPQETDSDLGVSLKIGKGWEGLPGVLEGQVRMGRATKPWQSEQEVPPKDKLGGLDSVSAFFRGKKDVADGIKAQAQTSQVIVRGGGKWEGAKGQWCRVPNKLTQTITSDVGGATCLAFSSFGTFLAVASMAADRRAPIVVVNVATGKEVATLHGHSDLVYDMQFAPRHRPPARGDSNLPFLLSSSADGTARVWDLATCKERTTAYHPSFVYSASFFANPISAGAGKSSGEKELSDAFADRKEESGEGGAGGHGGGVDGISSQDMAQCSHVITGSFDHLLRVWRVCNAERIIPKAISASVCAPSFCDLLYPNELQADGTVLLLAMEPRCSLLVGDAIIVYLAGFGIIDAEAGSKGCTSSANRDGWGKDHETGNWEVMSDDSTRCDKPLHITIEESSGSEKGVLLRMTVSASEISESEVLAVTIPEHLGMVVPWEEDELKRLLHAVKSSDIPKLEERVASLSVAAEPVAATAGKRMSAKERAKADEEAMNKERKRKVEAAEATRASTAEWIRLREYLRTPRVWGELREAWKASGGRAGGSVLGQGRPDDCLAYVPLNPRKEWPVRVRSISGKSAFQRSVDTEDSSHHGRLQSSAEAAHQDEADATISFRPTHNMYKGDTITLHLDGFRGAQTYLGTTRSTGKDRYLTTYLQNWDGRSKVRPLQFECETMTGVARLTLRVARQCVAGKVLEISLTELFRSSLKDTGLRLPALRKDAEGYLLPKPGKEFGACMVSTHGLSMAFTLPTTVQAGDVACFNLPEGFEGPETESLFVCGKEGMHGLASAQLEDAGEGRAVDGWRDECFNWSSCSFDKDEKVTKLSMRCVSSGGGRTTHLITIPSLQPRLPTSGLHPIRWPRASHGATYSSVGGSLRCGAWLSKAVLMQKVSDHTSFVNSIDVDRSMSGAGRIYSADGAGVVRIWQVNATRVDASGAPTEETAGSRWQMRLGQAKLPLAIPDLAGVSIVCVRIDPKGRYIALLSLDNMLRLVRKDTHEIACRLSGVTCAGANACLKCRFSPDGSFISAGSEVGKVNIWRVDTGGRVCHNFETFSRECTDVVWSPCDRVLATASLSHRAPAIVYSYDPRAEQSASVQGAEDLVRDALEGRWEDLLGAFSTMDDSGDGKLQWGEFSSAARSLQIEVRDSELAQLFSSMAVYDSSQAIPGKRRAQGGGVGEVSYEDFVKRLAPDRWLAITKKKEEDAEVERRIREAEKENKRAEEAAAKSGGAIAGQGGRIGGAESMMLPPGSVKSVVEGGRALRPLRMGRGATAAMELLNLLGADEEKALPTGVSTAALDTSTRKQAQGGGGHQGTDAGGGGGGGAREGEEGVVAVLKRRQRRGTAPIGEEEGGVGGRRARR